MNDYDNANELTAMKQSPDMNGSKKLTRKFCSSCSKTWTGRTRTSSTSVQIVEKHIRLPKIGWVKAVIPRTCEGKIKSVTVSKTKSEIDAPELQEFRPGCVGVDFGLKSFLVTSDGMEVRAPKHLEKSQKRLVRLQRKLSWTKKVQVVRRRCVWQSLTNTGRWLISGKIFCTSQAGGWWTTTGSSASKICL